MKLQINLLTRSLIPSVVIWLLLMIGPKTENQVFWKFWLDTVAKPTVIMLVQHRNQSSDDRDDKDEVKS